MVDETKLRHSVYFHGRFNISKNNILTRASAHGLPLEEKYTCTLGGSILGNSPSGLPLFEIDSHSSVPKELRDRLIEISPANLQDNVFLRALGVVKTRHLKLDKSTSKQNLVVILEHTEYNSKIRDRVTFQIEFVLPGNNFMINRPAVVRVGRLCWISGFIRGYDAKRGMIIAETTNLSVQSEELFRIGVNYISYPVYFDGPIEILNKFGIFDHDALVSFTNPETGAIQIPIRAWAYESTLEENKTYDLHGSIIPEWASDTPSFTIDSYPGFQNGVIQKSPTNFHGNISIQGLGVVIDCYEERDKTTQQQNLVVTLQHNSQTDRKVSFQIDYIIPGINYMRDTFEPLEIGRECLISGTICGYNAEGRVIIAQATSLSVKYKDRMYQVWEKSSSITRMAVPLDLNSFDESVPSEIPAGGNGQRGDSASIKLEHESDDEDKANTQTSIETQDANVKPPRCSLRSHHNRRARTGTRSSPYPFRNRNTTPTSTSKQDVNVKPPPPRYPFRNTNIRARTAASRC